MSVMMTVLMYQVAFGNVHAALDGRRREAKKDNKNGPRV